MTEASRKDLSWDKSTVTSSKDRDSEELKNSSLDLQFKNIFITKILVKAFVVCIVPYWPFIRAGIREAGRLSRGCLQFLGGGGLHCPERAMPARWEPDHSRAEILFTI